jgi:hypothetical protein
MRDIGPSEPLGGKERREKSPTKPKFVFNTCCVFFSCLIDEQNQMQIFMKDSVVDLDPDLVGSGPFRSDLDVWDVIRIWILA